VQQKLGDFIQGEVTGHVFDVLEGIHWQLELNAKQINLPQLHEQIPFASNHGVIHIGGQPGALSLRGDIHLVSHQYGEYVSKLNLIQDQHAWRLTDINMEQAQGKLHVQGNAAWFDDQAYTFELHWQNLKAIPWIDAPYTSEKGHAVGKGTLKSLHMTADFQLAGGDIPSGNWALTGKTDFHSADFSAIKGQVLGGEIQGNGTIQWLPFISWNAELRTENINPVAWRSQWPGNLSAHILSHGALKNNRPALAIQIKKLQGRLRNQPLSGSGEFEINNDTYRFQQFKINYGKAIMDIDGDLGESWSLRWKVQSPQLSYILPDALGKLSLTGDIEGKLDKPKINAHLTAEGLKSALITVKDLHADVQLEFNRPMMHLLSVKPMAWIDTLADIKVDIKSKQLQYAETAVDALNLTIAGSHQAHDMRLQIHSRFGDADLFTKGKAVNGTWKQTWQKAHVHVPGFGDWQLQSQTAMNISDKHITMDRFCLINGAANLCQSMKWQTAGVLQLSGEVLNFPLPWLSDFLPKALAVSAQLDSLEWSARLAPGQELQAQGTLRTGSGYASYVIPGGEIIAVEHKHSQADFSFGRDHLSGHVLINLNGGLVNSTFNIPVGTNMPTKDFSIDTTAKMTSIKQIFSLLPMLSETDGLFEGHLALDGQLQNPKITALQGHLQNASTTLRDAGISPKEINLKVALTDNENLTFSGSFLSSGRLNVSGSVENFAGPWRLKAAVHGKHVKVINTENHLMLMSPDLDIDTVDDTITITGQIDIPKARFEPKDMTTAVSVSKDEIIVGKQIQPVKNRQIKVSSQVKISFGDEVRFKLATLGNKIEGKITGTLRVTDKPDLPVLGNGELNIVEGKVDALGQQLDIERGRFNFRGGPIDTPALDIQAMREIDNNKLGVKIRGTWPRVTLVLVSDPPMNESEILSYLITGRPIGELSQPEKQSVYARWALVGDLVASRVKKSIGLDDISVTPQETVNKEKSTQTQDISLQLGKYLSSNLYIGYGIGLIEKAQSINIRYKIRKGIAFQASGSDAQQSGDILFTIEKERVTSKKDKEEDDDDDF